MFQPQMKSAESYMNACSLTRRIALRLLLRCTLILWFTWSQETTRAKQPPELGASNAIDKLLTTDENKLSVGPALDSKSAANHDARLISAGVLSVFIEKTER